MSRRPRKKSGGLSYAQFEQRVKAGRIEPLYAFVGAEDYLQEKAVRLLCGTVDEGARLLNVAAFRIGADYGGGGRVSPAAVVDACNQLPMMAGRRIVVVREFEKLTEDEASPLLRYIEQPAPTTTLVFRSPSLDQRRKITEALLKACTLVSLDPLGEEELRSWAEDHLKQRGCQIEPRALGTLLALAGMNMLRVASELDKLASYAAGSVISEKAVEQLVPRAREHSNFELWDAILQRDRTRALRLVHRLMDDGAEPVMIVGALAGLFRRMLVAQELLARGARPDEIARATGQYGFRGTAFNNRVGRTQRDDIVRGMKRIAEVDNAIKRSEATPRLQLEYLVAELSR